MENELIIKLRQKVVELEADKARLIEERDEAEKALREYGHYDKPSKDTQWMEYK